MLDRMLLQARTAAPLRWQQWVYRPVRRVQALLPVRSRGSAEPHTGMHARLADAVHAWGAADGVQSLATADAVLTGEYRFLNHSEFLPRIDWSTRHVGHLWSYNLHYFDYALDLAWAWHATRDPQYARGFAALARGWIAGNPSGMGDGWEPYALSLRTVNWMYALLLFSDALDDSSRADITHSIALQLDVLERRLELHILANHLQKNLKALVIGGLYFTGSPAARWLRRGSRLLWREVLEQVLPDGSHFERSPMYHAIALGDFLELISLCDAAGVGAPHDARQRIRTMVGATGTLIRPDGRAHLFNDAAHGIPPSRSRLDHLAGVALDDAVPTANGIMELPDAGYFGMVDSSTGERLFADCGDPGPSYQPGHAHCDLLSFELDLLGRSVVIDAGVHGYDGDRFREYVRSTRAHNTVTIGGREQLEVWGTFRVARRARVRSASHNMLPDGSYVFRGSYAPYHDRHVSHHRTIERRDSMWRITDRVEGANGSGLESFIHLHPDFVLTADGSRWVASCAGLTVLIEPFGVNAVTLHSAEESPLQGWYCPEFGLAIPAPVLRLVVDHNDGSDFGYVVRRLANR